MNTWAVYLRSYCSTVLNTHSSTEPFKAIDSYCHTLLLSFSISCVKEIVLLLFPYYYSLSPVTLLLRKIIFEDRIPIPAQQWSHSSQTYCCAYMYNYICIYPCIAILAKVDDFFYIFSY